MKGKETFRVYPGTPFCDIEACPHREAIARCYSRGWFLRMAATRFGPDRPMERAMLAAVLHRVAGCPGGGEAPGEIWARARGFALPEDLYRPLSRGEAAQAVDIFFPPQ